MNRRPSGAEKLHIALATPKRPVEPVHGGVESLGDPDGDGLRGEDQGVVDGGAFGAAEPGQDEVGGVGLAAVADPDAEPGEGVGAELGGDVPQPFLPAVGAAAADPQLPQGEV